MSLSKFSFLFTAYTALLILLSYLLKNTFELSAYFVPKYWVLFGFMAGINIISYLVSWLGIKKGGEGQVLMSLGGVVIRLLLSMFIALFYIKKHPVEPVIFIINFFSVYFLFTAFEIYCLLVNLRHQNKK